MEKGEQLITIGAGAKHVKKSEEYVRREYIDTGKLRALRMGGTDKHPRLRIYLSELLSAIDRDAIWIPPAMRGRSAKWRRKPLEALHPAAAAM